MPSCVILKRSEQIGPSSNNSFTMTCCPPSSSLSSRTQSLIVQWGFIPRERRTAWDVLSQRSLISGLCPFLSRTISWRQRSSRPCGQGIESQAMSGCSTTASWLWPGGRCSKRLNATAYRTLRLRTCIRPWVTRSIETGSMPWCTLLMVHRMQLTSWFIWLLSVQSAFSEQLVLQLCTLEASMPTSWIYSCSRTWASVASLRSSSAGWMIQMLGGYVNYDLPEPVATWYGSFYTDYMTYLDIADLDSVLAAQVASPGSQITIQFIALALEKAEEQARDSGMTLNEFLENRTIADIVDQFTQEENCEWLTGNDFFMGNNGYFTIVREVSEGSHDVTMAETVSSDVSMTDAEVPTAQGDAQDTAATLDESGATVQSATSQETAGLSSSSASGQRTVLGAEAPPGLLLAIEDVKPDEFYQASDQIRSALQNLPEQIQNQEETQLSAWVHSTDGYNNDLWTDNEYARKACDRTGARIHFAIYPLRFGPDHPHMKNYTRVAIPGLLPYLDDYIMGAHDPFVEDFHWSMDDNRHTESKSPELTEGDVPNLLLFAEKEVINRVRTQATSSSEPAMRRDLRGSRTFGQAEIKRHRQGLKVDELSSTDVVDVTVFNLGNLARQSVQRQAEPRMLRLIMNQTSHIMMLVEGTSLAVNQWDEKLRAANWTLGSSDDHHHWVGVRTASTGTSVTPLIDNCGSHHQKIWYAIFDVTAGEYLRWQASMEGWTEFLQGYGCPHQSLRCSNSLPVLQNQLCRSAGFVCPLPGWLDGRRLQRLQLPVLSHGQLADCNFSARLVTCCDVATIWWGHQFQERLHHEPPWVQVQEWFVHGIPWWTHWWVPLDSGSNHGWGDWCRARVDQDPKTSEGSSGVWWELWRDRIDQLQLGPYSDPISKPSAFRQECSRAEEHDHQEQVCRPLFGWPGEDVQIVRHGAEDNAGALAASSAWPWHAQGSQGCIAALANSCRKGGPDWLWTEWPCQGVLTSEQTTSARIGMRMSRTGTSWERPPLIVQIRQEAAVLSLSSRWTSSSMRWRGRAPLPNWTMDWSLVHPVRLQAQHWEHFHHQVLKA